MTINPTVPHTLSPAMAEKAQAHEKVNEAMPQKAAETAGTKDGASADAKRFDTFEKRGDSAPNPAGIYRLGEDENGNPKILFEKPEQEEKSGGEPSEPEEAPKSERDKEAGDTKCTVNTDRVDAEIKKLKQEKQETERRLQAEEDTDKRVKLEQQLKSLEMELQTKDNDAYRKQHASYTYS